MARRRKAAVMQGSACVIVCNCMTVEKQAVGENSRCSLSNVTANIKLVTDFHTVSRCAAIRHFSLVMCDFRSQLPDGSSTREGNHSWMWIVWDMLSLTDPPMRQLPLSELAAHCV